VAIGSESFFLAPPEISPDALARSLQALLPTRHHPIARHRFTLLDTFDGRVCRSGARLTRQNVVTPPWSRGSLVVGDDR
jgi:hypothetical protein